MENDTHPRLEHAPDTLEAGHSRSILTYFRESPAETATLKDLSAYVAARQNDADARSRETIRISLHHVDLPKLDATGVLEYDPRSTTARYWGQP